jgi:type I restriction enzyme R subunit
VIVRDMWLTGFDAPCLHTMYVDKPMRGHGLMQAIARVNRVFKDKPGGLVVDYLGLADQLKYALANYTESGGKGETAIDQEEAVAVMLEKYEVCCGIFHGFDWSPWKSGGPQERLSVLPAAQEHVLAQNDGKNRLVRAVGDLSKAFALAVPHEKALEIRDDVAFFQAVKSVLTKGTPDDRRSAEEIEFAIRQIVSKAVSSDEVIDIFAAAGLKKPDISIFPTSSWRKCAACRKGTWRWRCCASCWKARSRHADRKNVVQARSFAELLENAIKKYRNRAIETAQVIEELIALAKDLREAGQRGEKLGLTEDEVAFYDALEVNDSAVAVLGDETLRQIAQELVKAVREQHHHRLDRPGKRPGADAGDHQAHPAEIRLPAGQAGPRYRARARAGGGPLQGLGGISVKWKHLTTASTRTGNSAALQCQPVMRKVSEPYPWTGARC